MDTGGFKRVTLAYQDLRKDCKMTLMVTGDFEKVTLIFQDFEIG